MTTFAITALADGGNVVMLESGGQDGDNPYDKNIYAQRFDILARQDRLHKRNMKVGGTINA